MTEPILPKGKKPKVEFECVRCKNQAYLDKIGYDRLNRITPIRVCTKCGTRFIKVQDQFVRVPETLFIKMR